MRLIYGWCEGRFVVSVLDASYQPLHRISMSREEAAVVMARVEAGPPPNETETGPAFELPYTGKVL